MSQYAAPIIWVLLIIVSVLSFSLTNVTICIFGFVLTLTNLMGYIKCAKDHKAKVSGFLFDKAKKTLTIEQMAKIGQFASKYNK